MDLSKHVDKKVLLFAPRCCLPDLEHSHKPGPLVDLVTTTTTTTLSIRFSNIPYCTLASSSLSSLLPLKHPMPYQQNQTSTCPRCPGCVFSPHGSVPAHIPVHLINMNPVLNYGCRCRIAFNIIY